MKGSLGPSWGPSWGRWEHFGSLLEASVTLLDCPGVSRGSVGALLGCLGVLLDCLGALLASPGASSGALGGLWAPLEGLLGSLEALWGSPGRPSGALGGRFEALRKRFQDNAGSESPPEPICSRMSRAKRQFSQNPPARFPVRSVPLS